MENIQENNENLSEFLSEEQKEAVEKKSAAHAFWDLLKAPSENAKESSSEKIASFTDKFKALVNQKNSNKVFMVSLALILILFVFWRVHQIKHKSDAKAVYLQETKIIRKNPEVIPLAGKEVFPDEEGFSSPESKAPLQKTVKNKDEMESLLFMMNVKIEEINQKLEALQESSKPPLSAGLHEEEKKKKPTVKVLGVIQNPSDGLWHSDLLINDRAFDVMKGDNVGGIQITNISKSGVNWSYED